MLINLLCGPRSLSTATMYSFAQRDDITVFDEPLYAHWLAKYPHVYRPYREELLKAQDTNGNNVLKMLASAPTPEKPIAFAKHIVKQLIDTDKNLLLFGREGSPTGTNSPSPSTPPVTIKNVFLIRDPLDMIASWDVKNGVHQEGCTLEATSLPQMVLLFSEIRSLTGSPPIVVDSSLLKKYPREILTELCKRLEIPFQESQLSWPAGPKPDIDGLWAHLWYDSVHKSTGYGSGNGETSFESRKAFPPLTPEMLAVYREAAPFYEIMRRHAIGVHPLCPGSSAAPLYLPLASGNANANGSGNGNAGSVSGILDHGLSAVTDPRNENILAWVGDRLLPRELAKVSCFDSSVQGGDAVWEGIRVYGGRVFKLEEHLQRLMDSSKAMGFAGIPTKEYIREAIFKTLSANGMRDNAHMRLTLTRGAKVTSSMNPVFNIFGCNLIILPEWKPVGSATSYDNLKGIRLITAAGRRNPPACVDSKIHHNNLINNILPKIQANHAGAADALMLDTEGFVSETNACNVFMVKNGVVLTPHADFCLPGITRSTVINIVRTSLTDLQMIERRISLTEFYCADEIFTTGTMGELSPVVDLDGRIIGNGTPGPVTLRIQASYRLLTESEGVPIPI